MIYGRSWIATEKRVKLNPYLMPYTKSSKMEQRIQQKICSCEALTEQHRRQATWHWSWPCSFFKIFFIFIFSFYFFYRWCQKHWHWNKNFKVILSHLKVSGPVSHGIILSLRLKAWERGQGKWRCGSWDPQIVEQKGVPAQRCMCVYVCVCSAYTHVYTYTQTNRHTEIHTCRRGKGCSFPPWVWWESLADWVVSAVIEERSLQFSHLYMSVFSRNSVHLLDSLIQSTLYLN